MFLLIKIIKYKIYVFFMAFFNTRECLQEMKTRLKIFPLKCSLAVQTLVDIKYHYLDQSSTKCSQLLLESSEIVCETGQPPLSPPFMRKVPT